MPGSVEQLPTPEGLTRAARTFMEESGLNRIPAELAVSPDCAGVQIYEEPLVGIAAADDPLFTGEFKEPQVIGEHFRTPEEWVPGAASVISLFFPFTEAVRVSNRTRNDMPYDPTITNQRCSALWLHARIEGQKLVAMLCLHLCELLQEAGFWAVAPSLSPEFRMASPFNSNWSERHVAFAAGLGTFGLSKGIITAKGMAGRLGSVVTDAPMAPTPRPYTSPFEYCAMCGACARRCPAGAIDASRGCALGKDQLVCGPYVKGSYLAPHGPEGIVRYGCGKCQVGVPCEHGIPKRREHLQ